MWSVCRRRSEFSTAVMIQRREAPRWLGSSPIGRLTLVASTTSSRRPFERLADDLLGFAVGVGGVDEVDPGVQRLVDDADRVVVVGVADGEANIMAPSAYGLTLMPVRPRVRYCMSSSWFGVGRFDAVYWRKRNNFPETIRNDFPVIKDGFECRKHPRRRQRRQRGRRTTQRRRSARRSEDRLRDVRRRRAGKGDRRSRRSRRRNAVPALPTALGPDRRRTSARDRCLRRRRAGTQRDSRAKDALAQWLHRYTDFVGTKRGLATALHSGDPAFDALPGYFWDRLGPVLTDLLDTATSAGQIRTDVKAKDLLTAVALLCHPAPDTGPAFSRRMVGLLLDGLRNPEQARR